MKIPWILVIALEFVANFYAGVIGHSSQAFETNVSLVQFFDFYKTILLNSIINISVRTYFCYVLSSTLVQMGQKEQDNI